MKRRICKRVHEAFQVANDAGRPRRPAPLGTNQAGMSKQLAPLHNHGPPISRPWLSHVGKRRRLAAEVRLRMAAPRGRARESQA